jgi:hypothetical protein
VIQTRTMAPKKKKRRAQHARSVPGAGRCPSFERGGEGLAARGDGGGDDGDDKSASVSGISA